MGCGIGAVWCGPQFVLFDNGAAWKSAANASDGEDWGAEFEKFGTRLLTMSDWCQGKDIKATICKNFLSITDHIFSLKLKKAYLYSEGAESLPKRYAMITYRLAALLAWWEIMERLQEDGLEPPKQFEIGERHFKIALMITTTLLDHALLFVKGLPNHNKGAFQLRPDMGALWDKFSDLFTRKEGLALAKELGISPDRFNKGLKRWVDSGSLKKNGHGQYEKLKPN